MDVAPDVIKKSESRPNSFTGTSFTGRFDTENIFFVCASISSAIAAIALTVVREPSVN